MGRRRQAKRHVKYAQGESQHTPDPLSRSIATHPLKELVAVAVGPCVRLAELGATPEVRTLGGDAGAAEGNSMVRLVAFSPDGRLLMTAGDQKVVRLWDMATWECVASWKSPKKVSAGTFTQDSRYLIFADKYGDVLIGDCSIRNDAAQPQTPALLFGHLCSVISALIVSPDNKWVISTDKDRKVRVSLLPEQPMLGSVEIQSYCLGHTYFVSSCAWVAAAQPGGPPLLVTGSGDGTVRLWDPEHGKLLDTVVLSEPEPDAPGQQGEQGQDAAGSADAVMEDASAAGATEASASGCGVGEEDEEGEGEEDGDAAGAGPGGEDGGEGQGGEEEEGGGGGDGGDGDGEDMEDKIDMGPKCAPVTCVASSHDGLLVAALVEGRDEVALLRVDPAAGKLALAGSFILPAVRFPSRAAFDVKDRLWVCGGPPLDSSQSAHVGAARASGDGTLAPCTSDLLPAPVLAALELRKEEEEKQVASGALVPAYTKQLITYRKRWFTTDRLAQAKRQRRDFRESERLRALEQEEAQKQQGQGERQEQQAGQ